MALLCCMTGCTAEPAQDVHYFPLPTKPALLKRWLAVISPRRKLRAGASVCSRHFAETDYETVRGKTRLKRDRVPVKLGQKTQPTDDHSNDSNESKSKSNETDITKDKDSNTIEEGSKDSEKGAENVENGGDEKYSETGGELGGNADSGGGREKGDPMEIETNGMNGAEESHDANAVEIQITPDIIEDYNPIQVTPDIIEDYDALKPPEPLGPSSEHDIEDILTNYHIMNAPGRLEREPEKPDEKPAEKHEKPSETESDEKPAEKPSEKQPDREKPSEKPTEESIHTIDDDDDLPLGVCSAPVFIEIPVDAGRNKQSSDRNDCLMVLESVQVSIDPSALLLPELDQEIEIEILDKSEHDL